MKLQLENRHILEKNDIEIIEMGDLVVWTQTKDKERHSTSVICNPLPSCELRLTCLLFPPSNSLLIDCIPSYSSDIKARLWS